MRAKNNYQKLIIISKRTKNFFVSFSKWLLAEGTQEICTYSNFLLFLDSYSLMNKFIIWLTLTQTHDCLFSEIVHVHFWIMIFLIVLHLNDL